MNRVFLSGGLVLASILATVNVAKGEAEPAYSSPQYLFFHIAPTDPDPGMRWVQQDPDSFSRDLFDDLTEKIEPVENEDLKIGLSFSFSLLQDPVDVLVESLQALLDLSEETGIPVQINVDGQNWWGNRPDLWNWWDPDKPGYDPDNRYNVEWTDWDPDSAVKIGWRDWGRQIRVRPEPNLMSPAVREATLDALRPMAAAVAEWWRDLPNEKKHLLGGFRVGWETSIGVNAYHYPDGNRYYEQWPEDSSNDPTHGRNHAEGYFGGLAPLGHAALKTAGIKTSGEITPNDIAEVVRRYLAELSKAAHEEGIPKRLLFTHQGGTYEPWEKHLPFWPAINEWATPGWSFYGVDPEEPPGLARAMGERGRERWAAVEWWWGAPDAEGWRDHFERTLRWKDCRFVTVYNWNQGMFREEPAGLQAVHELLHTYEAR